MDESIGRILHGSNKSYIRYKKLIFHEKQGLEPLFLHGETAVVIVKQKTAAPRRF